MLIAREKKKNNIAEYILYMWQLEDMLRALKLDMEQVDRYLVAGFQADERTSKEIHDWYDNLIAIMQKEKVEEKGHIQALKNTVDELTELHFFLLHRLMKGYIGNWLPRRPEILLSLVGKPVWKYPSRNWNLL